MSEKWKLYVLEMKVCHDNSLCGDGDVEHERKIYREKKYAKAKWNQIKKLRLYL